MTLATRTILILTLMAAIAGGVSAQETTATPVTTTATAAPPVTIDTQAAQHTRQQFLKLLARHPSDVGKVVALDPTLLTNAPFLARYPEIGQFLAEHPEIRRNPHFYVPERESTFQLPKRNAWQDVIEAISVTFVFGFVAFFLAWLIRTVIEQRRWSRLSQIQAEVHNKIMDRFGSGEELLAYMKTPAGARFLESAPIPLYGEPARMGAPMARVLWSIQIGLIVAAAGIGMLLVSGRFERETAEGFFAMGTIASCVGGGFIVSAVVSMVLSRRLGLWPAAKTLPDDSGPVR